MSDWHFTKAVDGNLVPWLAEEILELPIHEIHAGNARFQPNMLEILLQEKIDGQWLYRRDPKIRLNAEDLICSTAAGVPFLTPEVALLFKARYCRPKDNDDFAIAFPKLSTQQKLWLQEALTICHPEHEWLTEINC